MKNRKLIILITIVGYTLLCFIIFYYKAIPNIIERRAKDLGLMHYDGNKDKFVAKDSINIIGWEIYYLQFGNMNGYYGF